MPRPVRPDGGGGQAERHRHLERHGRERLAQQRAGEVGVRRPLLAAPLVEHELDRHDRGGEGHEDDGEHRDGRGRRAGRAGAPGRRRPRTRAATRRACPVRPTRPRGPPSGEIATIAASTALVAAMHGEPGGDDQPVQARAVAPAADHDRGRDQADQRRPRLERHVQRRRRIREPQRRGQRDGDRRGQGRGGGERVDQPLAREAEALRSRPGEAGPGGGTCCRAQRGGSGRSGPVMVALITPQLTSDAAFGPPKMRGLLVHALTFGVLPDEWHKWQGLPTQPTRTAGYVIRPEGPSAAARDRRSQAAGPERGAGRRPRSARLRTAAPHWSARAK